MEDLKKLDDEVVRCAEAAAATLAYSLQRLGCEPGAEVKALFAAIAAKRSASRPKLLSADEAFEIHRHTPGSIRDGMQAILDADRASILKVIEGLPMAEVGGYLGHGMKTVVSLDDIRSALTSARE